MTQSSRGPAIEKILPLNKSIISKIEKISQDSQTKMNFNFTVMMPLQTSSTCSQQIDTTAPLVHFQSVFGSRVDDRLSLFRSPQKTDMEMPATVDNKVHLQKMAQKSGSFESALPSSNNNANKLDSKKKIKHFPSTHSKNKQSRRLKLQFDDRNFMDCGNINDFLSSSSLSSSDSEAEETNESDHEGDDELTDWPGHEVMVNFASKNEFKRANKKVGKLPQIDIIQDDDTLMSADDIQEPEELPSVLPISIASPPFPDAIDVEVPDNTYVPSSKIQTSHPINIIGGALGSSFIPGSSSTSGVIVDGGYGSSFATSYNHKQPVESEMSGETSNHFLSSPNTFGAGEVREIRAGCRRIREERPGFSIITSFNEDLLR